MSQEKIENEIAVNGNRKTVLGIRCYAELKFALSEEADNLGITLSEHAENILLNKQGLIIEKDEALMEVEIQKNKCLKLEALLVRKEGLIATKQNYFENEEQKLIDEKDKFKIEAQKKNLENEKLKMEMELMKQQVGLFSDPRLLFLFENVKGQKDTIDGADGQKYNVTYNHTKDLLEAMIYSFNIKKP